MRKHLTLLLAVLCLAAIQITATWWFSRPPPPKVLQRVERIHVDVASGLFYVTMGAGPGTSMEIAMTPHAVLQLQVEMARALSEIQGQASHAL